MNRFPFLCFVASALLVTAAGAWQRRDGIAIDAVLREKLAEYAARA